MHWSRLCRCWCRYVAEALKRWTAPCLCFIIAAAVVVAFVVVAVVVVVVVAVAVVPSGTVMRVSGWQLPAQVPRHLRLLVQPLP